MAIRELRTVFTAHADSLRKALDDIQKDFKDVSKETEAAAKKVQESWDNTGKKMQDIGKKATTFISVPLAAAGTAGTKFALDQEKAFNKVSTMLDESTTDFDKYKKDIRAASSDMGVAFDEYSESVYGSISAGIEAGDAIEFTGKAVKLAKGGFTDTATAVDVMTTAINAYGLEASDADRISDMLINTQNLGKTTVDELASSMGAVIPTANAQNVSLEQLSTGYAILTKNGIATSEAGTYMKAMFGELGKSGSQTDEILREKLGKSFAELSAEGMNTSEILNVLKEEAENSGMSLSDLFGSSEAGAAALTLIKDGGDDFNQTLISMSDSAGATQQAFDKMENSAGVKMEKALNSLKNSAASFGDMVLPVVATLAEYLAKVADKIQSLGPSAKWLIMIMGLIATAIGPVLLALGSVARALAPVMAGIKKAGGMMKILRLAMVAITGPIGLTVAALVGLGALFVTLYKRSETFRNAIASAGEKIKEFGGKVKTAFEAVKALFEGNSVKAGALLSSLGLSDDQIKRVFVIFVQLKTKAEEALSAITGYFSKTLQKIKSFWNSEGPQITAAAENIFGFLKKGAEIAGKVIGAAFKGIYSVIQFIMPAVLAVVKMVWGNIQGVISGALDVIMGAVKIFSGLFTGDFKKMWEGIKQVFFGAIKLVWNAIQLTFFGRIAKGAALFAGAFRSLFAKLWTAVTSLFRNSVLSILNTVIKFFTNLATRSKAIFTGFRSMLSGIWSNIQGFVTRIASNIFTSVRNTWQNLSSRTSEIFRGIYNNIKQRFTDIVNAAKALPKRIGDGIGSMASKVKTGVTKVINQLAKTLGKGVNGVIGGVNWVLGKIGIAKKNNIPTWTVPQYAQGTKGAHPGGPAVVNDGKGSNSGPEMIRTPDGESFMLKGKDILTNLPEGTQVWSARETRKILEMVPHYALGDLKNKVRSAGEWVEDKYTSGKKAIKNVGSKIKDVALNVFDYIKNPSGLLDLALKTLGIDRPEGGSFVGNMARGGFDKLKSSAINFVKDKLSDFELTGSGISLTGGNGGGFGAPFRLTSKPGPRNTGIPGASTFHKGWDWAAPIGTPIPSVTDGVGHRTGYHYLSGNFVEVRDNNGKIHRYQHNSRNLLKVGQPVKKGQTIALVGNTGVGSGAHLHYEVKGYQDGGIVDKAQLAWLAEGGYAESVISHDPTKKISQRRIWQKTGEELGFGPPGSEGNDRIVDVLEEILVAIENGHEHPIFIGDRETAKALKPALDKLNRSDARVKKIYE